ncbi:pyridoxal phosphate-dependent aminotransferase [Bythopirellula polymerisocia]|uniref:Aminotransferase n=1 Tax=Bythopirellula polymerisocia TaxID=2528003 RepID=A0A5C6CFY6_9BACT|nr:aminotransferase class I/II-fold pyridoxal phosphate-dependent enzyme [Bythopirellula polymerisocia]TWU23550.1 putative N-acetyl-LL-diaminopimelate aminotransferase [Bythopirellula polymerisocia]
MSHPWLAQRTSEFDSSGIRKVFDLAAKMANPINLSIGQPDFPVPDAVKDAAIDAIHSDKNGYSLTQGIPPLREALQSRVDAEYGHADRQVMVTSGTSGALVMAMLAMVDPGDEVIFMDPYFVMYPALVRMVGGKCVMIDTYPDFAIDPDKVAAAITPRTKLIMLNSPANPTGVIASKESVRAIAELAAKHNIALLSDEIYRTFSYDSVPPSPAQWNDQTLVVDGFSKTYGVTGWRLGWIHGPAAIIDKLTMLQQYTFVCAPHPLQWAGLAALETDMSAQVAEYQVRRDYVVSGLREAGYEVAPTGGAFYVFPKVPDGGATGAEFVLRAIERELLIIPGNIFSERDTHFRISYAATMETLQRGLEVLRELAE